MKEKYGCNTEDIIVCIGPCIKQCHFEVEENSFMPVSEIYSKRNLTHDESCVVFDSAETLYSSISMFAFLTSEKTIVDNYEKIWKNITNSGKYE